MIETCGAEILPHGLQRMAERFADAASQIGSILQGPERE